MNILKKGNKNKLHVSFIALVLIITSFSSILLFSIPANACFRKVGTFESDFMTPKTTFIQGGTVYGNGTSSQIRYFKLRIRDPTDQIVFYSDEAYGTEITDSWKLDENAPVGEWDIQLGEFYHKIWHWSEEPGKIAHFYVLERPGYSLSISVNSLGTVEKYPDQETYKNGTLVTLTAIPGTGWEFDSWSGDIASNENPTTILMTDNKTVIAHLTDTTNSEDNDNEEPTNNPGTKESTKKDNQQNNVAVNLKPIAKISNDEIYQFFINSNIVFNGSYSYDPDGYITSWYWDFGDGNNAESEIITHSYESPGTYTITLSVTDDKGAVDESESLVIEIQENKLREDAEIDDPIIFNEEPDLEEKNTNENNFPFIPIALFALILLVILLILSKKIKRKKK